MARERSIHWGRPGLPALRAGSETRPEKPALLTFRCDRRGQSEKFLSDEP